MRASLRLSSLLLLAAAPALWAPSALFAASPDQEGFRAEGSTYVSVASGTGSSAQEAEVAARGAALRGLFDGLGKDRLFAEVFTASPPLSLSVKVLNSSRAMLSYKALVRIEVDDESIRIIERGAYLAAAIGLLDKAEAQSDEAEARRASAADAESQGDIGTALGQYGMAIDDSRGALQLVDPLADPSLFSTKGKRTAPELKKGIASILANAQAGVERVKQAEALLAADQTTAAANDVADSVIAAADKAQGLIDEISPVLSDVSAYGQERLMALRDRVAIQRRGLSDSKTELERAQAALPKEGGGYVGDKLDFAGHRLGTADASLAAAFSAIDREIRDPAARRAARAQAIRWTFLHLPREYLSLRAYLPFMVGSGVLSGHPADLDADVEGAFTMGSGGVWVRSLVGLTSSDLEPGIAGGDELAFTQSFDFGVWGSKGLFFGGYAWDWLRQVDDASFPKSGTVELGIGGVYEHGPQNERFRRADWLLSLSYELPYSTSDFMLWNVLNAGLDAQFRLGDIALLQASVSKRLDELSDQGDQPKFVSMLRWAVGLGLRLPPPFAIGVEYFGAYAQPLLGGDSLGPPINFTGGNFRFYLQYSI